MADKAVLVLTRQADPTSDHVIAELNRRGVPVVRLDPAELMTGGAELVAFYGSDGLSGRLLTSSRELDLAGVRSVYHRRPSDYHPPADMGEQDARFALAQARQGFGGVLGTLPARYVNHPWHLMRADHKPAQLAVAAEVGFDVPATIVTNSAASSRAFASTHGPIVYKPLRVPPFRSKEGDIGMVWVDLVDPRELDERICCTAHVFQVATASKVADVRIVVIGDRVFGVRIKSPYLDFRRDYSKVRYTVFDVPDHVVRACSEYLARFGLLFGAFDLGLRDDGSLAFYECNGSGQWLWLEEETGLPMTAALADLLELTT